MALKQMNYQEKKKIQTQALFSHFNLLTSCLEEITYRIQGFACFKLATQ